MDIWGEYNQINPQKMEGLFFLSVLQFKQWYGFNPENESPGR